MGKAQAILDGSFQPKQIYEQVAERIRADIRSGRIMADERLPSERELSSRFRVGRPAVREAIGALQNQGLVITRRNAGTYVSSDAMQRLSMTAAASAGVTDADVSPGATLDLRRILEPAIARRAAQRAKPDALAEHYLAQMASITDIDDPEQCALWNDSDRLFHRQLAVMTGDPLLVKVADVVASTMDQPLWKRLKDDGIYEAHRVQLYVSEHRLIYEAIVCGDADAAAMYVEQHVKRVGRDVVPR
ncbi:FadR/GntR family transcriptional regulator [Dyella nitratireducens]|uniref:GntR family transcriptional regulator n=1 Tax=Dyella nitratireducens TaxID=1849580 RepID=A0ABQ1GHY6_9GAMM|nr:GntR family transcriptional regulator [Dyella nitratireducens]GGA44194.1 GntR family transcriptional regulator [Dyella nitratireducens]GLQ41775.1 GntR family transcriptional regulator [Dyella nitratireducens]